MNLDAPLRSPVLCVVKPDGMKQNLSNLVLKTLIEHNLVIVEAFRLVMSTHEAEELYRPHERANFFRDQINFMTSGQSMVINVVGLDAPVQLRRVVDQIRAVHKRSVRENVVHGSDSIEAGVRETAIFFPA